MTSTSDDHVIKKSVKIYHTDEDNDARKRLGTEAIEQLASGLNLAAHTIQEYSQDVSDFFSIPLLLRQVKLRYRRTSSTCEIVKYNRMVYCINIFYGRLHTKLTKKKP